VSKQNLDVIKQGLIARKQELEVKLKQLSREKVSDDQVQDPGDQAISSTMESLKNSFQDAEIEEYHRIVRALEKIDKGSYGICADCSQPISERRLQSYPNAARCLVCQETFEENK
jgi:DnaK suppressor protein